jgi:galactokinase
MTSPTDLDAIFASAFGRSAEVRAHAPGRVNLIGEHTDYSEGYVLPTAIPQVTRVALARRADGVVRAVSAEKGRDRLVEIALGREAKSGGWIDYVSGAIVGLRAKGHDVGGFDVAFASEVPIGAGLSSSAALEVALLRALRTAFGLALDDVELAKVGRAAETDFVGAPVGIMDPMAASLAGEGEALFVDTRTLRYERVPLPSSVAIVVIDSGVEHDHATGEYATRRAECERAAQLLGVGMLRDVTDVDRLSALPEPLRRRARHVVTENARVLAAVGALRAGDVRLLGKLLDASHASLHTDFEVSVDEVDRLVALAQADVECLGARMTGGGFGGAIVALARPGRGPDVARRVLEAYGPAGRVLVPRQEAGE